MIHLFICNEVQHFISWNPSTANQGNCVHFCYNRFLCCDCIWNNRKSVRFHCFKYWINFCSENERGKKTCNYFLLISLLYNTYFLPNADLITKSKQDYGWIGNCYKDSISKTLKNTIDLHNIIHATMPSVIIWPDKNKFDSILISNSLQVHISAWVSMKAKSTPSYLRSRMLGPNDYC